MVGTDVELFRTSNDRGSVLRICETSGEFIRRQKLDEIRLVIAGKK